MTACHLFAKLFNLFLVHYAILNRASSELENSFMFRK
jgi:hypothetical protein